MEGKTDKSLFPLPSSHFLTLSLSPFSAQVTDKRGEGKNPGEEGFSEGQYESSINQKQDNRRSHKDRLTDTEVPLTLNVSPLQRKVCESYSSF